MKTITERIAKFIIPIVLCVLAGAPALGVGVAQAQPPGLVLVGNFATEGGPGVAVDQASGDVFTAGLERFVNGESVGQGRIAKFDASGNALSLPEPFAEGFHAGAVVNPANGDLYVLNATGSIETYDPNTGALLSPPFEVVPSDNLFGFFTLVQIASDSAGNVYVPVVPQNEVLVYSPSGTLLRTITGTGAAALKEPTGVAIDSAGDVWVADSGNNRIEELSPTGAFVSEIASEGVHSVALGAHGDIFALVENGADFCGGQISPCAHLLGYNSAGSRIADVGAGDFGALHPTGAGALSMVAANEASGRVYVSDGQKDLVWIFGPPAAPAVGNELSAEVGTSEVKLGALVNPGGLQTSYRFEYDTREYGDGEAPHGQVTPLPDGSVGEGVSARTVWAAASGLTPGTTYHYRVIATNELGTATGPDRAFTTETAAQASCPNEQLRSGFSAKLPDCRAYELVTPPTKTSVQFESGQGGAARNGDRLSFRTQEPLPGAPAGGDFYLATRGASGWSAEDLIPLRSYTAVGCNEESGEPVGYSNDMSDAVVSVGDGTSAAQPTGATGACNAEDVQTVSGEPVGYENLLLRENATGDYRLINEPPAGVTPADAHFGGASADLSHVIFEEHAPLTPEAPPGADDLYEWSAGALRLVSVLPNGTPTGGALPVSEDGLGGGHDVSTDGARIFFTAAGGLYVRLNGSRTVQLDASQVGGSGGGATFWTANADGSRAFFTDDASAGLTSDTVAGSGANLYEYDLETGELVDITAASRADVSRVLATSEDGSYIYFLAEGSLAAGAVAGQRNLYVRHDGSTVFIVTLSLSDPAAAQASPDGTLFAFASSERQTHYDNIDAQGGPVVEIYLYNAISEQLVCASCNPSGEAPIGGGGASISAGVSRPHYLVDGGRLFFETREALVPSDTNGRADVYEYEGGEPRLISSGTSPQESKFLDASEDGSNVFILTRQALVPQDTEEAGRVVYDARIDGGFPFTGSPLACATADACRTPVSPQPSIYGAPSSQTFSGAGNLTQPVSSEPNAKPKRKAKSRHRSNTKRKQRPKSQACRRAKRKSARCATHTAGARAIVKSHREGK